MNQNVKKKKILQIHFFLIIQTKKREKTGQHWKKEEKYIQWIWDPENDIILEIAASHSVRQHTAIHKTKEKKKQTRIRMRNETHAIYYHKLGVINKGIHEYLHRPHTPVQETHNSIISKTRNT